MGLASAPLDSEGARALLQQRLSLFARVGVVLGLIVQALVRVVSVVAKGSPFSAGTEWTANVQLVVIFVVTAVWWRARSGRRSLRELAVLDVVSTFAPITFSMFALWHVDVILRPNLIQVLGMGNVLVLRAILVPSSGRRTAAFGLVTMTSIVGWSYLYYRTFGEKDVAPPELQAVSTFTWCFITLIISSLASYTIFGLRERIRETAQLGQYTLLRKLGEGGMGVVYEARHALLRRRAALKVLPPSKAGEQNLVRFEREVQMTAKLTHPNTVAIYDYGRSPDGVFYYVMEYLDGVDLQALVEHTGPQPPELVAHLLEQVSNALAEAHETGLIHRDIKPANIILCRRGGVPCVAKVVDFGLVRSITPSGDSGLSGTNVVLGTPLYLSPEAIANPEAVDARSDIYAIGAVGYFLLTGKPPFTGATVVEIAAHHLHTVPPRPSERLGRPVDSELEQLLLDCMAKEPGARPAGASALAERLRGTVAARGFSPELAKRTWEKCSALAAAREAGAEPGADTALDGTARQLTIELDLRRQ